jgi:hypothetical protein
LAWWSVCLLTAAASGTRPLLQRLAGGLRGAELSELPDAGPAAAGAMALGEAEPDYPLHLSAHARGLFWEDRQ